MRVTRMKTDRKRKPESRSGNKPMAAGKPSRGWPESPKGKPIAMPVRKVNPGMEGVHGGGEVHIHIHHHEAKGKAHKAKEKR